MRILVVPKEFPSEQNPQAGIFILRRIQALRALGHDLQVLRFVPYAPPFGAKWRGYRGVPQFEEREGVPVRTVRAPIPPRLIGMEYLPVILQPALQREIVRFRPDVLHASFLIPCGQLVARSALPSVITAHGVDAYDWPLRRPGLFRAAREAIRKATRVTTVSGYIRDRVTDVAPRPVDVIWNGGDERFFYPRDRTQARNKIRVRHDQTILAYAGNVLRAKGLFDLVEALSAVPRAQRPLLVVAGTGPDLTEMTALALKRDVEIRFMGRLPQAGVADLFAAADIVTLPSHKEGLPNVVCEAMLAKRAVLATTVGGIPEIVVDGESGLLVPPHDVEALARGVQTLSGDQKLRDGLAEAARAFAETHLTWPVAAHKYQRVYEEALQAHAVSHRLARRESLT